MNATSGFPRYVVIHGHFYQPPRENPWIESIEKQESASPYHDWNERIANECYIPNGIARVVDNDQKIVDLVNNYAYMSFNFGPTLLSWYETFHRREYQRLLAADGLSLKRLGHGNALAQAYNHRILPLAKKRDKITQIRWGIEDFRHRFGREPEAMWLPETACNPATLELLAEHGMKYVILSPTQAYRIRPMGSHSWFDVSNGTVDPRRPYRFYLSADRKQHIDIFFYDGNLSRAIAFERLMKDAGKCAAWFEGCFDADAKEPQIVSVATDGESYGHHEAFADMTLAYLLKYEFPRRGITVTNYSRYLELYPPNWEAEIKEGADGEGTAWSCGHGVGRWKDDCGCGREGQQHQKWRKPLKEALDWLEEEISFLYEELGAPLLKDVWEARNAYIRVILKRNAETTDRFLTEFLKEPSRDDHKVKALRLLEMQRHAQLMFTSCGWFFSEISGIEAVQNLKYASRAIQLARKLSGRDLEKDFLLRLAQAPSNIPQLANGRNVYNKCVSPSVVTFEKIMAHYAFRLLFKETPETSSFYGYQIQRRSCYSKMTLERKMAVAQAGISSDITRETAEKLFFIVYQVAPKFILRVYTKPFANEQELETLRRKVESVTDDTRFETIEGWGKEYFQECYFTLKDLFADEREKILRRLLREKFEKLSNSYRLIFREFLPTLEEFHELGEELPREIRAQIEFVIREELVTCLYRFDKEKSMSLIEGALPNLELAAKYQIPAATSQSEHLFRSAILSEFWLFWIEWTLDRCRRLTRLVEFAKMAGFNEWRYPMENQVFNALIEKVYPQLRTAKGEEAQFLNEVIDLARFLNINVEASRRVFEDAVMNSAQEVPSS